MGRGTIAAYESLEAQEEDGRRGMSRYMSMLAEALRTCYLGMDATKLINGP